MFRVIVDSCQCKESGCTSVQEKLIHRGNSQTDAEEFGELVLERYDDPISYE